MTHRGKAIDDMEEFDDQISSDDGEVPAEIVDQLHFVD